MGAPQRAGEPIEEIVVQDEAANAYRTDRADLTKLTEPLRDVPQSIVSVPRELFEDRGATSLIRNARSRPSPSGAESERKRHRRRAASAAQFKDIHLAEQGR